MNNHLRFGEYANWMETVYEEDPLLMLSQYIPHHFGVPKDNELIVLSSSPDQLEQILK